MNRHVQTYATEYERIVRKKRKLQQITTAAATAAAATNSSGAATTKTMQPPGVTTSARSATATIPDERPQPRSPADRVYAIHGTCREREATLAVSFAILKKEVEKFVAMTDLFRKQLRERPDDLKHEIRENLERELKRNKKKDRRIANGTAAAATRTRTSNRSKRVSSVRK
eukprot:CAMPEP_0168201774 /NCGR_PEP_ID=MMETSP0139_2-20121125/23907_1 /TAXON_ID=44445 /ORGANISM="Pseudo-nitzschia australis, Strain 10249 10 AB" /LENGTH=170 /DNA_ID=CAMNT_0008127395 /DNA_START=42 /DNA_END=553 /DNA_ORIENTATION=+